MTKVTKRQANIIDKEIEAIFREHCAGVQIPILRLSEIFAAGHQAAIDGRDLVQAVIAAARAMAVQS